MSFMILSNQRSGSNFLANVTRAHPSVDLIIEPLGTNIDIFKSEDLSHWTAEQYNAGYLHRVFRGMPEAIHFLKDFRRWIYSPLPGQRGFKETLLLRKIPWLQRFLPGISIIFLVRDPRAVVASILKRSMDRFWNSRSILQKYLVEKSVSSFEPNLDNEVKVNAMIWKIRTDTALKALKYTNFLQVRLEDLISRPNYTLERIMKYLGTSTHQAQLKYVARRWGKTKKEAFSTFRRPREVLCSWRETLSDRDRRMVEAITREELVRFEYL